MQPSARRTATLRLPAALAAAVLLSACGGDSPTQVKPPDCGSDVVSASLAVLPVPPGPYAELYRRAGAEFGVPAALLRGIAYVETREQMVRGHEELGDRPAAFGLMALRGPALRTAAALAGVSPEAVRTQPEANVRAAAALLAAFGQAAHVDGDSPSDWAPAVARYSGIELPEAQRTYVSQVVSAAGGPVGRLLAAVASDCHQTPPPPPPQNATDYAGAVWHGSPNFNYRQPGDGGVPQMIIIHTCEGNYTGCWSWLANPASQVSAHYVVDEDGGEITQLVREANRAWHIGATYNCALNDRVLCNLNGVQANHFTIGVEHAGYADRPDPWPETQIAASARLVCDITKRWSIPRDFAHIVGHGQLQPSDRHDPGARWPWTHYIGLIQHYCGETVADDDAGKNDATWARVVASGTWTESTDTAGYYGRGYRWATSSPDAQGAMDFQLHVDSAGTHTVEARWTSGPNRSPAATYVVVSAAGDTLAQVAVDQRSGGGKWQKLGQWDLPAGWTHVLLSTEGPAGSVVVGDAARIR